MEQNYRWAVYDVKRKVLHVYDEFSFLKRRPWETLNFKQLLNPIFYSREVRHPDMKRQACRKQRAKELRDARRLKRQFAKQIPAELVPSIGRFVYSATLDCWYDESTRIAVWEARNLHD